MIVANLALSVGHLVDGKKSILTESLAVLSPPPGEDTERQNLAGRKLSMPEIR